MRRALVACAALIVVGCGRDAQRPTPATGGEKRVVAMGDVHGDLEAARAALRLAGAIDERDRWIGGTLTVVQTGDQIDRGDDEREIIELFDRLAREARAAGGAVLPLNGNHEVMNVAGDLRYVTPDGMADFGGEAGRRAAFAPGGEMARLLASRPVVLVHDGVVYAHGGLLAHHVDHGIDALNAATRAWMIGETPAPPDGLVADDAPIWTRRWGGALDENACAELAAVLEKAGARRLVVGHTVQKGGITSGCDGKVWRIDVGMARHYGGPIEVLQVAPGAPTPLRR